MPIHGTKEDTPNVKKKKKKKKEKSAVSDFRGLELFLIASPNVVSEFQDFVGEHRLRQETFAISLG